jgi:hypothetical protein
MANFIEIKPKQMELELPEFIANPELEKQLIQKELEKKLLLYKNTTGDLLNSYNNLKRYCETCIEDKIFCSNCQIEFLIVRFERVLERCY